mmetsp:Transcript_34542/g.90106  ORF Transcript_34542/g.90106 Transcript_34542/m.90106 type:complete len:224 (+) Transcript_34542:832-1503(+)
MIPLASMDIHAHGAIAGVLRCPLWQQVDVPPGHTPVGVVHKRLHPLAAGNEDGQSDGVVLEDCDDLVVPGPHHRCLHLQQLRIREECGKPRELFRVLKSVHHVPQNRPDRHDCIHWEGSVKPCQQHSAVPFLCCGPRVLVALFLDTKLGQQIASGVGQYRDVERRHQLGVVVVVEPGEGDHDAVRCSTHTLQPGEDTVLGAGLHVLRGHTGCRSHKRLLCQLV